MRLVKTSMVTGGQALGLSVAGNVTFITTKAFPSRRLINPDYQIESAQWADSMEKFRLVIIQDFIRKLLSKLILDFGKCLKYLHDDDDDDDNDDDNDDYDEKAHSPTDLITRLFVEQPRLNRVC